MTISPSSVRTVLCAALLSIAGLALSVSPANAGVLVDRAESCDSHTLEQPFLPWLDEFNYVLAPGGTFERRERWTLTGGARLVRGNERYYVHRRGEARSLSLPAGSSATSPAMCIGWEYPTLRMFALKKGSALSLLKVEILYEDPLGIVQEPLPIGVLQASNSWQPTVPVTLAVNVLTLLEPDNRTAVAFRFSPLNSGGDWRIDDVYVDPYRRG